LIAEKDININRKVQRCYTFYVEDDEIYYAIKRYVHVFEEGDKHENYDNMTKRFGCLSGRFESLEAHFTRYPDPRHLENWIALNEA
jgi:hypothetical protein